MAAAPEASGMQTLAARLATFDGPKQLSKRRASSTKKKTPGTVSWPHKSPTPEQLAKAGFYYRPTAESSDSVSCFLCGKSLDGWEEGDNPATEHLNHVPECGWAINTCIEQRSQDDDRVEEDPLSEKMAEARRATFQDQWPHEHKKGWKCKTQKMVAAGWCYSPLPEFDDCVVCFYCGTSLDGWEPKDDPWNEHKKRAPDCHFFSLIEESTSLKKQTRGRKPRGSKASRTSAMSAVTMGPEEASFASLNEPPAEDESMLSTVSTASKPSRGRKRAPRARPGTARAAKVDPAEDSHVDAAVDSMEPGDAPAEETEQPPAKRGRKKRNESETPQVHESMLAIDDQEAKVPAKKAAAKKRTTKKAQKDESLLETRPEPEPDLSIMSTQTDSKPKRGRKRTSDGEEKVDSSVVVVHADEKPKEVAKPKSKRTTAKKQPDFEVANDNRDGQDEMQADEPAEEPKPRKTQKKTAERKKAPAKKQAKAPEPEAEAQPLEEEAVASPVHVDEDQVEAEPLASPPRRAQKPAKVMSPSPQSSDAENVPPSSRPSSNDRPRQMPLSPAPDNVQTPRTSPSKRKQIGGLVSSLPWNGVDLENILLPSPGSGQPWDAAQIKLDQVLAHLESPEKRMTVEEWIVHNASQAEGRLRNECEKMIVKFENEGNRALRAVEGIDCGS